MDIKNNTSLFLIMTLIFCAETKTMTIGNQRAAVRTSAVIKRTPYRFMHQLGQMPSTGFESSREFRRFFGSLQGTSQKRSMVAMSWFTSPLLLKTQQNRYFSFKRFSAADIDLIVKAIKSGSTQDLRDLIKKESININARYNNDDTILHLAAENDASPAIISLLIGVGANVHAENDLGHTALHTAVKNDNVEAVKLLVASGANPNAATAYVTAFSRSLSFTKGNCPLYLAQSNNWPSEKTFEIIRFLEPLTNKSLWFVVTPEVRLERAIIHKQTDTVKRLLSEHKFSKNSLSEALHASFSVTAEILALLIDAGANVNIKGGLRERTPLHEAANWNNLEAVKILLAKEANPNARDLDGKTPLDLAIETLYPSEETPEIIRILKPLTRKSVRQKEPSASDGKKADQPKKIKDTQEELLDAWEMVSEKKPVYELLGLNKTSSKANINEAFKKWIRKHHPDLYPDKALKEKAHAILKYLNEHLR